MAFLQTKMCQTLLATQRLPHLSMVRLQSNAMLQRTRRWLVYDIRRCMSNEVKTEEIQRRPEMRMPEMTTGWHTTRTQVDELIDIYRNTPEDPKIEARRRKHLLWTLFTIAGLFVSIMAFLVSITLYFAYFPI